MSKIIFIVMVTLTFDPKINRVLPLPQGNHVAKFVKDPIYRTKVIVRKIVHNTTLLHRGTHTAVKNRSYYNLTSQRHTDVKLEAQH